MPFSYMKGYVERLDRGEKIERSITAIAEERDRIVAEYRGLIKTDEDRKSFDDAYNVSGPFTGMRKTTSSGWSTGCTPSGLPRCGSSAAILQKFGVVKKVDDIFLFNRFEIPMLIEDISTTWALGEGVPTRGKYWKAKAEKREKDTRCCQEMDSRSLPLVCRPTEVWNRLRSCSGGSLRTR